MGKKILLLCFVLACSLQSLAYETTNPKDSCALTLQTLNVIKISNLKPLDLTSLSIGTKIDIFSNLAKATPVKPLLLVKFDDEQGERVVAIRDLLSLEQVNGEWQAISHNNLTDFIVRFTDGTQAYLSQIKSVQLVDFQNHSSVQVVLTDSRKRARFTFTPDDKVEDVIMRVSEGNAEAMSFLMDVIAYQTQTMSDEKDKPLSEEDQQLQIKQLLMIIAGYNIGGAQLVSARDLFSGSESERAKEFFEAILIEPVNLAAKINARAPVGYHHRAVVPEI